MDLIFMEHFLVVYFLVANLNPLYLSPDNFLLIFFSFPNKFQYHLLYDLMYLKLWYQVIFVDFTCPALFY